MLCFSDDLGTEGVCWSVPNDVWATCALTTYLRQLLSYRRRSLCAKWRNNDAQRPPTECIATGNTSACYPTKSPPSISSSVRVKRKYSSSEATDTVERHIGEAGIKNITEKSPPKHDQKWTRLCDLLPLWSSWCRHFRWNVKTIEGYDVLNF